MTMDKTEIMALADRLGAVSGRCSHERDRETIIAASSALRLAAGASAGAAYAERLAVALWEKHYKITAPEWKPLTGDLVGLLTQIDNMTAALTPEPVKAGDYWQSMYTDLLKRVDAGEFAPVKAGDEVMREALDAAAAHGWRVGRDACVAWCNSNGCLTAGELLSRLPAAEPGCKALSTTAPQLDNGARPLGMDWKLSDDAKERLAEIDAAIVRPGDPRLNQIVGGPSQFNNVANPPPSDTAPAEPVALLNRLWSQFYDRRPPGDPKDTYRELKAMITAHPPRSVDVDAVERALHDLIGQSEDTPTILTSRGRNTIARFIAALIEGLPSRPIAPAAPVSVDTTDVTRVVYENSPSFSWGECEAIARALLDAFKMERK